LNPTKDVLEIDRGFVLASGIECSTPTVNGSRVDQLEDTGHYANLKRDLQLVDHIGLRYLRYGIPFHRVNPAPGQYDWSFADSALAELRRLGITPIVDLMHFGVPDDVVNYQNPQLPERFRQYAAAFAQRYPWVRYYTVVNEPLITASFSARLGYWNEQRQDDRSFTRALLNVARCVVLGADAIREQEPNALFLQSDSCEVYHPVHQKAIERAEFFNQLRFVAFELYYGRTLPGVVADYLLANGAGRDELRWFERNGSDSNHIAGNDYYAACEKEVLVDGSLRECGERSGYYALALQYQRRLGVPIMHMETNNGEADAVDWFHRQWTDVVRLRREGVPIRGFTWYGFVNHVDWDTALRERNGHENALGLVNLRREPMPLWETYRAIIEAEQEPSRALPAAA
jgi:beta-glucosidase/6-phospho-beta-glucosidase/beta-galactosidase